MSDQEFGVNIHAGRATHRLTLDSEEDQKIQQEQQRLLEEKKLKRQQRQKRKRREQQEEEQPEEACKQIELQNNDLNVNLFQQDSNSKADFQRAKRKIKKFYPAFKQPKQKAIQKKQKKRELSPEQSDLQQSKSAPRKKPEKIKKIEKTEKKPQKKSSDKKKQPQKIVQAKPKIKREQQSSKHSSKKDLLIKQVAIRWWYAMPQFPPKDFDYQKELSKLGYRSVDKSVYRQMEEYVNGLQKVEPVDGFVGVYRNKYKLIDVRPKQNTPSLEYFNSLSVEQLTNLLKSALKQQIHQLRNVKYQQSGQRQLLVDLQRKVNKLEA